MYKGGEVARTEVRDFILRIPECGYVKNPSLKEAWRVILEGCREVTAEAGIVNSFFREVTAETGVINSSNVGSKSGFTEGDTVYRISGSVPSDVTGFRDDWRRCPSKRLKGASLFMVPWGHTCHLFKHLAEIVRIIKPQYV